MVKYIFHIADLHIPNTFEVRPYDKMIDSFMEQLSNHVDSLIEKGVERNEIRICVVGDIFHNKIKVSNEARMCLHSLLNKLNDLADTIIIAGNHDMLENNKDRCDSLTPTFEIKGVYDNVLYLDKELDYKSGFLEDDNIVWCLYSMFDEFSKPNSIELEKDENTKVVGLYHGNIPSATTDTGRVIEDGVDMSWFDICDFVLCGHIHKHQMIKHNGIKAVYSGSVFQQNLGENISGHGYCLWDVDNETFDFFEVENEYRMFNATMTSFDGFKTGEVKIVNM